LSSLPAASSRGKAAASARKSAKIVVCTDADIHDLHPMNFRLDTGHEPVIQTYEVPVGNTILRQGGVYQDAASRLIQARTMPGGDHRVRD
jgi:hypothetical protein